MRSLYTPRLAAITAALVCPRALPRWALPSHALPPILHATASRTVIGPCPPPPPAALQRGVNRQLPKKHRKNWVPKKIFSKRGC